MGRQIMPEHLAEQGAWVKTKCEKVSCCSLRCFHIAGIDATQLAGEFYTREAAYTALDNELNERYALQQESHRDDN